MDDLNLLPLPVDTIDQMICSRGLPIVVPPNLQEIQIPTNLLKSSRLQHRHPTTHVERFEEVLISSLVIYPCHYLI